MTEIECELCQYKFNVEEGDVQDEDAEMDGFACPSCGQTTYHQRRDWG